MSEQQAAEMLELMRQLLDDLAALRAQGEAIAKYTSRTAKLLDKAMPDGDVLSVRVTG